VITVYEHQALYVHKGEQQLSEQDLLALQRYHKEKDFPYYSLVHNGVKFCEYVGVIQIGALCIEILPKADRNESQEHWRTLLIDMLRSSGTFTVSAPSSAALKLKPNSVLEHYFELFLSHTEQLAHHGLIKRYRKTQGNCLAMKGKLLMGRHLAKNLAHQERFYVQHNVYDHEHLLNQILLKALKLLAESNLSPSLSARAAKLMLDLPELQDISVSQQTFDAIRYDRKSQAYQSAIGIARLLLLNFHPDLSQGRNDVLALLFNMNVLWERFVLKALQRFSPGEFTAHGQLGREFWQPEKGRTRTIRPDIVVKSSERPLFVLDTKWKNISVQAASDDDLRQLYAYSRFHGKAKVCLLYPGETNSYTEGAFLEEQTEADLTGDSGIMKLRINTATRAGQSDLALQIFSYMGFGSSVPGVAETL
jgi:5-methylcytosine-specific restriction enzyme subunit McrC